MRIVRNSAKCAHCGYEMESTDRHDFRTHLCKTGPVIGKQKEWVGNVFTETDKDQYPSFSVDGGKEYIRRLFTRREDYIETSIEE